MKGKMRIVSFLILGILIGLLVGFQVPMAEENVGQQPLFLGVHHVGLYTGQQTDSLTLAKWYEKNFGFRFIETPASYFAPLQTAGSLEIMKNEPQVKGHLGIQVSDIEAARKDLESKGIELEPTVDVGPLLTAYIKGTDPAGYKVHLSYIK
jgi:hypothetical protein